MVPLAPYFCCLLHPFVTGIEMNTALLTPTMKFWFFWFPSLITSHVEFLNSSENTPDHVTYILSYLNHPIDQWQIRHTETHTMSLMRSVIHSFLLIQVEFGLYTLLLLYWVIHIFLVQFTEVFRHYQSAARAILVSSLMHVSSNRSWPCSYPRDSGRLAVHVVSITSAPQ